MKVGCNGETSIDHRLVPSQTNPNVMSLATDTLILVYPTLASSMTSTTVSLNGTVEWFSNVAGCGAFKITSYSDLACTSLTSASEPIRLETNPTTKDVTNNNIVFNYG